MNIEKWRRGLPTGILLAIAFSSVSGCLSADPAPRMIAMVDSMPAEKRPPDWERTKTLMSRQPPEVGSIAPDFTLTGVDESEPVRLSTYSPGRPKVLIFASFT